ncbi:MAG: ATP synthase F1 subunit gamma [Deltaproteobacteria bacterium]|jgi:F-type H+-transporting ATPase subunit gamma|nr:ATP synthase F1 subunit gamma [Deltaproteobacteria bacterium]
MASLKDIKRHITAVRQTQKLTKAMNMVAAAKLRATQGRTEKLKDYADEFDRLLEEIGRRSGTALADFLKPPEDSNKALVAVISSDRGLCGSFNANLFSVTDKLVKELRGRGLEVSLYIVGRKAFDYYSRRKGDKYKAHVGLMGDINFRKAKTIAGEIHEAYSGPDAFSEVHLVYTRFENINRHPAQSSLFLPLAREEEAGPQEGPGAKPQEPSVPSSEAIDYLMEPPPEDFLERLVMNALNNRIFRALLESVTSENAARMQAMDNASSSCKDIIESLTMAYNKARQSSVTNELLDIVNGAEALKG